MSRKRPDRPARTEKRLFERGLRQVVRDREQLAALTVGGSPERPILVPSTSVIELRLAGMPCPQCEGEYRLVEDDAPGGGVRACRVACRQCGVSRTVWFKLAALFEPN